MVEAGRATEATQILLTERERLVTRGSEQHPLAAEAIYALARARLREGRAEDVLALVAEGEELARRVEGRDWLLAPLQELAAAARVVDVP